jgi:iron complex transport system ATP-binding protein
MRDVRGNYKMLSCTNIRLSCAEKKLIDDVSLTIPLGTVTLLIGPNGAGKSTLLKILSGDIKPDTGQVTLDQQALYTFPPLDLARRRAVVAQQTHIMFNLSVREIIQFGCEAVKRTHHIEMAAQRCRCEHLLTRRYHTLSGGEQARVHLARALAQLGADNTSGYLLLDEPVASLDPEQQHLTMQLIHDVASSGIGVFATLHDLNLTSQYADQIAMMQQGKIKYRGQVHEIICARPIEDVFNIALTGQIIQGKKIVATMPLSV